MMVNKAKVRKNFGKSAATYDDYAVVQKEMARELLARVKSTGCSYRTILEIGCGTGFFTELFAEEYPESLITAIDIAPEMIDFAKEKLSKHTNIRFLAADGEKLRSGNESLADKAFDLIVSNAVFQWFNDCPKAFAQYYKLLHTGGYLIFSTLGAGTFGELYVCLNNSTKVKTKQREPFVESKTLQDYLIQTGFTSVGVEEVTKQEYFPSCLEFLKALKKIGANHCLNGDLAAQGMGTDIFSLMKNYDAMFSNEQGVYATYQCLFGWGQRENE